MMLFPKGNQFFSKLEESSHNILASTRLLAEFINSEGLTEANLRQLEEKEHVGDRITHDTIEMLNKTFITPIDREDIHALFVKLDDVLDYVYGIANRMVLYKIGKPGEEFQRLAKILVKTVEEVAETVLRLRDIKHSERILAQCLEIGRLENEADDSHRRAVANLFDKETDAIRVIKIKEILDHMETATDKCQDVADVIEGIVVKNA